MRTQIKIIAFDADDTLWINEPYFQEAENHFCELLAGYLPPDAARQELFNTEMKNLHLYGYGIKGVILCMIETITRVSNGTAPLQLINQVLELGNDMLEKPIEILEGVEETLNALQGKYRLVIATKGDLLDQERKLNKSGLQNYFHHIEIMSNKKVANYQKLLKHLDCSPANFLMLGNSVKSDVLPVLALDAFAAHIPFHTTWQHELHEEKVEHPNLLSLNNIADIIQYLD
ncbi:MULTISPECIES: HAD family hydrolase [Niastella]|uniref:HAD family hydrolase n=1 Tax=Niastella soli TaxID=2821487 RepID=A0ABS3YTA3_9BACT|nr:HAD family hydrolase [Niastella soli]MBO9200817.1 HAD family hydrolase [Niastella soli]